MIFRRNIARWMLVGVILFAAFASVDYSSPARADSTVPFDLRDHPVYVIASYYNAISLHDYARAYGYWKNQPPNGATVEQFAAGFADVQDVRALARLPIVGGVAAGTAHSDVPVVVLTTLTNGITQIYAGCFHVTQTNVPIGDPPVFDPNWYINSAQLEPADSVDFVQAVSACDRAESFPTIGDHYSQYTPIDVLSSYYDAIAIHDYTRAYNYWIGGAPGQTLAQFAQGFAGTANVGVVVALSFNIGAAAGSAYADAPVLITATDSGVPQLFVGCFVMRQINVPVGDPPVVDPNWYLYRATIQPVSTLDLGVQSVWDACESEF